MDWFILLLFSAIVLLCCEGESDSSLTDELELIEKEYEQMEKEQKKHVKSYPDSNRAHCVGGRR